MTLDELKKQIPQLQSGQYSPQDLLAHAMMSRDVYNQQRRLLDMRGMSGMTADPKPTQAGPIAGSADYVNQMQDALHPMDLGKHVPEQLNTVAYPYNIMNSQSQSPDDRLKGAQDDDGNFLRLKQMMDSYGQTPR